MILKYQRCINMKQLEKTLNKSNIIQFDLIRIDDSLISSSVYNADDYRLPLKDYRMLLDGYPELLNDRIDYHNSELIIDRYISFVDKINPIDNIIYVRSENNNSIQTHIDELSQFKCHFFSNENCNNSISNKFDRECDIQKIFSFIRHLYDLWYTKHSIPINEHNYKNEIIFDEICKNYLVVYGGNFDSNDKSKDCQLCGFITKTYYNNILIKKYKLYPNI